jgi:thiol-disulfide isomerase/thioredoxin
MRSQIGQIFRLCLISLILTASCLASDQFYRGSLDPALRSEVPWSTQQMEPATDQDIALLPTKPPEHSRVFVCKLNVRKGGIPPVLVISPNGRAIVYVDTNLDGRFETQERFVLNPDSKFVASTVGALQIQVQRPCGSQATTPVSLRVSHEGETWDMLSTMRVVVSGMARIDGKESLLEYEMSCGSGTVDLKNGWQGIDLNGDGQVDVSTLSPESARAQNETVVFRVGTAFVSTESVDLQSRQVVLRSHPASDYQRIELDPGTPVPDFAFTDATGMPRRFQEFRGKYVLLDIWASWCGPCIAEMPRLKQVYDRFPRQDFEIVAINDDDDQDMEKARNIISEQGTGWPHALGPEARALVRSRFRNEGFPCHILLDREGRIISVGLDGQLPLYGVEELTATLNKLGLNSRHPGKTRDR